MTPESKRQPTRCGRRLRLLAALCSLGLLLAARPAPPSVQRAEFDTRLSRVEQLIDRGDYRAALEAAGQVNADAPPEAHRLQSAALTARARVLADLGEFDEADEALDAALTHLSGTPHAAQLVQILIARGELRQRRGDLRHARRHFEEAHRWNHAIRGTRIRARIQRALGRLAMVLGDHTLALQRFSAAAVACDDAERPALCRAHAAVGAAYVHLSRGDALTARRELVASLDPLRAAGDARAETRALAGLAEAHRLLGELQSAALVCDDALTSARRIKHKPLLADAHRLRGELALREGKTALARGHLEAAHAYYRSMGSRPGIAASRLILARLTRREGAAATEAEIHARAALRLYEAMEDAHGLVAATIELADLANQRGDHADEHRLLQAALERASAPRRTQLILTRLGHLARDAGHRDAAIDYLSRAAAASERVRTHRLAHAERDRVMAARQQTYDALLDALLAPGGASPTDVSAALMTSERGVARAFVDVLERARLRQTQPRAATIIAELDALDRRADRPMVVGAAARDTLGALTRKRAQLERELIRIDPRLVSVTDFDSRRISDAVLETGRSLGEGVALVKYHLAEPRSYVFVLRRNHLPELKILPGRSSIGKDVLAYHDSLKRPAGSDGEKRRRVQLAKRLYATLLSPIEDLLSDKARLVVVPHLELRMLPFDALVQVKPDRDSRRLATQLGTPPWSIYRYTFSYAPSVAALAELRRDARRRDATRRHPFVAFADPLYTGRAANLVRLDRSSLEARNANRYLGGGDGPGALFLREQATEERLKRLALNRYRVVHLAMHGFAPDVISARTQPALFLGASASDDGVLKLDEVLDLKLDADLVVLSACSSGRGQLSSGDGIGGLTRAFLYAGSSSVMATLWAVEDAHAASMMDVFYRNLAQDRASPEALRAARMALLRGVGVAAADHRDLRGIGRIVTEGAATPDARRPRRRAARSADPFFWASYILIGESGDILD